MNRIILTGLFFLFCNYAFGDCGYFVKIYPEKDVTRENSYIIIEGQGDDTSWGIIPVIEGLGTTYPVFLVCNNQRIKLSLKYVIKGQAGFAQAIFYPSQKLIIGNHYELDIENLTCDEEHNFTDKKKYNHLKEGYDFRSWTVMRDIDNENPILSTKPKLLEKKIQGFGCGIAVNTVFELEVKDDSEIIVLIELTEIESNTQVTYYQNIVESKIYVGKGMCNGAVIYKCNLNYEVRFKIYDINGNTNDKWTDRIKFSSPIYS